MDYDSYILCRNKQNGEVVGAHNHTPDGDWRVYQNIKDTLISITLSPSEFFKEYTILSGEKKVSVFGKN